MIVLGMYGGTAAGQHDPGAAIVQDGQLVAVCEEERYLRIKSAWASLPVESVRACLNLAGITLRDVDVLIHPGETHEGLTDRIKIYMTHYFGYCPSVELISHHLAHLSSAFYCSGFSQAMCLSYDGYGDGVSTALAVGTQRGVQIIETRDWKNSLGVFFSAITSYLGFQLAEDEYKIMGLAGYGRPGVDLSEFINLTADGYDVNPAIFRPGHSRLVNQEPLYSSALTSMLGPARLPGTPITQRDADVAFAAQQMLAACATALVEHLQSVTGQRSLCLAGGVALNCSVNGVLWRNPAIRDLFVQPAASDRGLGLGCALYGAFETGNGPAGRLPHAYYGSAYTEEQLRSALELTGHSYETCSDPGSVAAGLLASGQVLGWYQGRSEFGPRALGNRSILADPRSSQMKDIVNRRVKFREDFRPFAPAVLAERAGELFDLNADSPFMTIAFPVRDAWKAKLGAVTHVDGTARVQTVRRSENPLFYDLIAAFGEATGVPAVLNTSLNVRGQPIAETPVDAITTFAGSGMDALMLGRYLLRKK